MGCKSKKYLHIHDWNYWWGYYRCGKDWEPFHAAEFSLSEDEAGEAPFFHFDFHNWCRGYYVDTVGKNAKKIVEYIRTQLKEDLEYDQMSIKRKLDIDEAIEIYNLLNINIPLLNKVVTERSTRNYGFIMINDIDNRLFQTALTKKQYTESSLKYLKSYIPNTFKTSTNYMLTNKQVFLFSKYPSIIKFINHGTFEYLKNKNGIIFKVDTLPNMVSKELGEIREYCLENDDQIEDKLYNYISNVQFVNSSLYENTIYLQNCIFGSDIIDAN